MSKKAHSFGDSIRATRLRLGYSQEKMAEVFEVSRPTYCEIEKGVRVPLADKLEKLAKLGGISVASFYKDTNQGLVALLRLTSTEGTPNVQKEVTRFYKMCSRGAELSKRLGSPPRRGPAPYREPRPHSTSDAITQGVNVAREERRRLGLGARPISDMADLLTSQNIWASGAPLPDSISGLFLREEELGTVVLVNGAHNRARKRFSYAHEYAHCLLDVDPAAQISFQDKQTDRIEIRANAFAAEFLLPERGISKYLDSIGKDEKSHHDYFTYEGDTCKQEVKRTVISSERAINSCDVAMLANEFGVSYEAATYRLNSTNYINRKAMDGLLREIGFARKVLELLESSVYEVDTERKDRDIKRSIMAIVIHALHSNVLSKTELIAISDDIGFSWEDLSDLTF